jgi:hypothetical protein
LSIPNNASFAGVIPIWRRAATGGDEQYIGAVFV